MSIADKLITIAENVPKVYAAGKAAGGGGGTGSVEGYATVTFMNGDEVLFSCSVLKRSNCPDPVALGYIDTPIKESTDYYEYPLKGWSTTDGGGVESNALLNIQEDRTLFAVIPETERLYTIKFYDDEGNVYVTQKLGYGETPAYTPADRAGYAFEGWSPAISDVTGDADYHAIWTETEVAVVEITDSWDEIIAAVNDGTYKTKYKLGNYKPLDGLIAGDGWNKPVKMQIVAKNADELADGSGKAALTWVAMNHLTDSGAMNSQSLQSTTDDAGNKVYVAGTGYAGGWADCEMRNTTMPALKARMPANVQAAIKTVSKTSVCRDRHGEIICTTTADDVWLPSVREFFSDSTSFKEVGTATDNGITQFKENAGPVYSSLFYDNNSRKDKYDYFLRTGSIYMNSTPVIVYGVKRTGEHNYNFSPTNKYSIRPCFCF